MRAGQRAHSPAGQAVSPLAIGAPPALHHVQLFQGECDAGKDLASLCIAFEHVVAGASWGEHDDAAFIFEGEFIAGADGFLEGGATVDGAGDGAEDGLAAESVGDGPD